MDDLAAAPTQRTYEDAGRVRDQSFRSRKKAAKKVTSTPSPPPGKDPEIAPEPESEPETNHELDLLA